MRTDLNDCPWTAQQMRHHTRSILGVVGKVVLPFLDEPQQAPLSGAASGAATSSGELGVDARTAGVFIV